MPRTGLKVCVLGGKPSLVNGFWPKSRHFGFAFGQADMENSSLWHLQDCGPAVPPGPQACCPSRPAGLLSIQAHGPAVHPGLLASGLSIQIFAWGRPVPPHRGGGAHGEDKGKFKPTTKLLCIQLGPKFCTGARTTVPCRQTQTNYQLYPQQNSF